MTDLANAYPELYRRGLWDSDDNEVYERFMYDTTPEVVESKAKNSRTIAYIGGRAYWLFVDRPEESDDSFIVFPGEFANDTKEPGLNRPTGALLRALVAREIINPHATLVVQPNDTRKENNLNLSDDERKYMVSSGSTLPIYDRIRSVTGDSENATIIGLSQGAVVAAACIELGNPRAVAFVEAPNTIERSRVHLARDFATSGAHLHDNLEISGLPAQSISEKTRGFLAYGLGIPTRSNAALLRLMSKNSLSHALARGVDRGIGLTHSWASKTNVSPDEANQMIASQIGSTHKNYEAFMFGGELADHSITNVYQLVAALGRRAIENSGRL